jgi:hypothetical protein
MVVTARDGGDDGEEESTAVEVTDNNIQSKRTVVE